MGELLEEDRQHVREPDADELLDRPDAQHTRPARCSEMLTGRTVDLPNGAREDQEGLAGRR